MEPEGSLPYSQVTNMLVPEIIIPTQRTIKFHY
jgi:hypothetical protein